MILRTLTTMAVLTVSMLPWSAARAQDEATAPAGNPAQAEFGQDQLDLSSSWGAATACIELGDHTECYRSERELVEAHDEYGASADFAADGDIVILAACSTSLRLYRSNGFTGGTLILTTRGVVINLSTYGFDNDTSSYRVGACASVFWAGASGTGSVYPGPTGANASASQMVAGWNNVVSSVYLS